MDKLLALSTFAEVAQSGGFAKAARRLGVATSTVMRLIDALEGSLGTALVTRTTRQVTLTDSGAAYLEQVTRLLAELDDADGSIADNGVDPVGLLRVAMPVTYGRLCLGPHLAHFLRMYPRLSLDLMLSDSVVDLATERIDVAVRIDVPTKDPSLVVKVLSEHHRFVVTSHEYVAKLGAPARPQELADHDCLRFAYQPGRQRWTFRRGAVSQQVDINGRLAANNSDILREAILGGQGIALLPQWLVQHDVSSGQMLRLFADWTINPKHEAVCIHVAYLPNRRHSRKVHAFIDFLTECAVSSVKG